MLLITYAIYLVIRHREKYNLFTKDYWSFIFTPTKFVIYVLGIIILVVPIYGKEIYSWDYQIAVFQPTLSYLTAPWAINVFYGVFKGSSSFTKIYVAICMMLFTGSWSVELYILARHGFFMDDWVDNIWIGIYCYMLVGTLWNISWSKGRIYFGYPLKNSD